MPFFRVSRLYNVLTNGNERNRFCFSSRISSLLCRLAVIDFGFVVTTNPALEPPNHLGSFDCELVYVDVILSPNVQHSYLEGV